MSLPYATLVLYEIYHGEYRGTTITFSEDETLHRLREVLFDPETRKLKVLDEVNFPIDVTLDNTMHLNAYELANLNNENENRSQSLYSVNGSIGGRVIIDSN
jgi:hypothetical protein